MKHIALALSLLALVVSQGPLLGLGLIIVPEQEHWRPPIIIHPPPPRWPPQPMPPWRPHPFAPLEVTSAKVNVRITDQVAVTIVDQEFYNPNPGRLEGTFLFPVPKGAHLDKFTMEIDGKPMEAELLAADKARGIYEDIVRKMRDPALLEYSEQDVFKVRIFPIEPRSPKRISLRYTQLLKSDDGLVGYALPLGAGRFSAQPIKSVAVKVELETKRPLKTVYSPSHKVEIRRDGPSKAVAGYEASNVQPDADFALYFTAEKSEIGLNLLSWRESGEDGYFLLLASPGLDADPKQIVPKDVAFVLDTSGSMAGKKLEQARKALEFCVENLNEGDRFEIVRFSTEVEPLFNALTVASRANRDKALDFIKGLKPTGGTAIDDAMKKSLALRPAGGDRPFVVIFLTDGRPTIGETDEARILAGAKRDAGATRVFCFGIGTDVNTHLLDKITDATRAVSQYVLPEEDIEVKVSGFFAKIREPVLANPALTFGGSLRATKLYPSPLPDLFRGDQLVLAGRYSGEGDAALTLEGTVNGAKRKFVYEAKFPARSTENDFIPRLWATRRVGWLLDEIRLRGENAELRDEVTELARKYGIVTPYTAYLIVEDETRRGVAVNAQTLPQLREDRAAFGVANRAYDSLAAAKSGDEAVVNSLASSDLRYSLAPAGSTGMAREQSARFMRRYGADAASRAGTPSAAATSEVAAAERITQYAQQQRFVNNRAFFQNGNQWVDAGVQQLQNARRVRVQFASAEYFELARKQPEVRPWLALGQNVQFILNGTIYEVYEQES